MSANQSAPAQSQPPQLTSKQEIVATVKEWFQLEMEMETLRKELAVRRKRKTVVDELLNNVMERLQLKEGIDIPTKKGKLVQTVKERKKPITKKMLMARIHTFFEGHAQHGVPDLSDDLVQHLLAQRETVLKRKIEFETFEEPVSEESKHVELDTSTGMDSSSSIY